MTAHITKDTYGLTPNGRAALFRKELVPAALAYAACGITDQAARSYDLRGTESGRYDSLCERR